MPAEANLSFPRFLRNVFLWLGPVALIWWLLTPFYNSMLIVGGEHLCRLLEIPSVTRLAQHEVHDCLIFRSGERGRASSGHVGSLRVTDTHFPLILTGALFLSVPGLSWRRRLSSLGYAFLISMAVHLVSIYFWVHFVYATRLGGWSAEHYGAFARNFFAGGKHLLDLPFKFGLPLILWSAFHLRLPPAREGSA